MAPRKLIVRSSSTSDDAAGNVSSKPQSHRTLPPPAPPKAADEMPARPRNAPPDYDDNEFGFPESDDANDTQNRPPMQRPPSPPQACAKPTVTDAPRRIQIVAKPLPTLPPPPLLPPPSLPPTSQVPDLPARKPVSPTYQKPFLVAPVPTLTAPLMDIMIVPPPPIEVPSPETERAKPKFKTNIEASPLMKAKPAPAANSNASTVSSVEPASAFGVQLKRPPLPNVPPPCAPPPSLPPPVIPPPPVPAASTTSAAPASHTSKADALSKPRAPPVVHPKPSAAPPSSSQEKASRQNERPAPPEAPAVATRTSFGTAFGIQLKPAASAPPTQLPEVIENKEEVVVTRMRRSSSDVTAHAPVSARGMLPNSLQSTPNRRSSLTFQDNAMDAAPDRGMDFGNRLLSMFLSDFSVFTPFL